MISVQDSKTGTTTRAVQFLGTQESLNEICQLEGITPALKYITSDGATMIHLEHEIGTDILMLNAGDYVVASHHGYRGDVYSPNSFAQQFRPALLN